jgi:hypothetical protein
MSDNVLSWLAVNDPALYTGPNGIYTSHSKDNLRSLHGSIISDAADLELAPARSTLTGGADKDKMLAADTAAQEALTKYGPQSQQFIDAFKNDLAGGATTLSEMARIAANYQPQTLDDPGANSAAYNDYLNRMGSNPLFILKMAKKETYERKSSDWNVVIDAIADTFTGIQGKNKEEIVKGLKNLAQAASSTMSTKQTQDLFVQNAMNLDGVVTLYLYTSRVEFIEQEHKGFHTKQVTFVIRQVLFELQSKLWPVYAEKVAQKYSAFVDNWLDNNNTTTAGTNKIPALEPY